MSLLSFVNYINGLLICAEGTPSSKMLSHFLRAVLINEAYSMSCGIERSRETPQANAEEAHAAPRGKGVPAAEIKSDNMFYIIN